jgi:serine/threonine-protein kinase ATR
MIYGSKSSEQTPESWKQLFFACRTAVRTEVGLSTAEFIMPLLVLDRICFGTTEDRLLVQQELIDVFRVDDAGFMEPSEKQRAVNTAFITIDTLQVWLDREVEERSRGRSSLATSSRGIRQLPSRSVSRDLSNSWSGEESIDKISDLLKSIPLDLQAAAAAQFGMNARALQLLELAARATTTMEIFETSVDDQKKSASKNGKRVLETTSVPREDWSSSIELMKEVLSRLDDCATMVAIGQDSLVFNPVQRIQDNIRQKEALGDYESALQDYERLLQAGASQDIRDDTFVNGSLRCLLELGRHESVLNQTLSLSEERKTASTFAVEAARKLGRWDTLRKVLANESEDVSLLGAAEGYQKLMGKMMLGLHRQEASIAEQCIRLARESVMQTLSAVATESYTKCYTQIVNLHILREVEDACPVLCNKGHGIDSDLDSIAYSTAIDGWSWKDRVDVTTPSGALEIIGTRAGLARLNCNSVLVGTLLLQAGHRARKNGQWSISEDLLCQSQMAVTAIGTQEIKSNPKLFCLVYSSQVQLAKVKFSCGECGMALKMLGQPIVDRAVAEMLPLMETPNALSELAVSCEDQLIRAISGTSEPAFEEESQAVSRFASRLLQLTRWTSEVGLRSSSEILGRFQLIQGLAPDWEKGTFICSIRGCSAIDGNSLPYVEGHFYYAKFVDSILQARMMAMMNGVAGEDGINCVDENDVRKETILHDRIAQAHAILAMRTYAAALRIDSKHVYQALPRLLSLWFDLVSVSRDRSAPDPPSKEDPISTYNIVPSGRRDNRSTSSLALSKTSCANIRIRRTRSWPVSSEKFPPLRFIRRCLS